MSAVPWVEDISLRAISGEESWRDFYAQRIADAVAAGLTPDPYDVSLYVEHRDTVERWREHHSDQLHRAVDRVGARRAAAHTADGAAPCRGRRDA